MLQAIHSEAVGRCRMGHFFLLCWQDGICCLLHIVRQHRCVAALLSCKCYFLCSSLCLAAHGVQRLDIA